MGDSYYKRLSAAKDAMTNPVKTNTAGVGKYSYNYEDLSQVMGIVRTALREQGLDIEQGITEGHLITKIIDVESDTEHFVDSRELFRTGDAQGDGSKETYARRYALKTIFCLVGEDDDGAAGSAPRASESRSKATSDSKSYLEPLREKVREIHASSGVEVKAITALAEGHIGKPASEFTRGEVAKAIMYLNETSWTEETK